jgi:putative transposase
MKNRTPYPSDLNDGQWVVLAPLVPEPKSGGRPPTHDRREIVNGILYVTRGGCAWRMMPHDLPKWKTTYHYFRAWRLDGTWTQIHDKLRGDLREAEGREREPSAAILDSQSVKTTEKGGRTATTRAKRSTAASVTSSSMCLV